MKGCVIMNDIDQIEELTLEAEMNVLITLCDCYEKQAMILEYSTSEDVSELSVFQEGLFEREEGESKLKTVALLPLRLIGFMVKMFTKFVKRCRDAIRDMRLEALLDKFDDKLYEERTLKNLVGFLKSDWSKFHNQFEVKYEDGKLKCLFRPARDPQNVQDLIDNFDITDVKYEGTLGFYQVTHVYFPIKDYLKKVEHMCDTIEKVILKQLKEQQEIFKNIGNVENFQTPDGRNLNGIAAKAEISDIRIDLNRSVQRWSELLRDLTSDIDACTKLYKRLEEYLNKHDVYFDGKKKKG